MGPAPVAGDYITPGAAAWVTIRMLLGDTDTPFAELKLQDSPDAVTWTDVAGGDMAGSTVGLPTAGDGETVWLWSINPANVNTHLRIAATVGVGVTGANFCIFADVYPAAASTTDPNAIAQLNV